MKRLRKKLHPQKLKYFACGEYGSKTERPHYHAIIFGYSPEIKNLIPHKKPNGDVVYSDTLLERIWKNGQLTVGGVSSDSIHYTTGYILKANLKKTALMAREKEFILTSRGLGKQYCEDHKEDLRELESVIANGVRSPIPRAYIKWLQNLYVESLDTDLSKEHKEALAKANAINKLKVLPQIEHKKYALMKKLVKDKTIDLFSLPNKNLTKRLVNKARKQNEKIVKQLINRSEGKI